MPPVQPLPTPLCSRHMATGEAVGRSRLAAWPGHRHIPRRSRQRGPIGHSQWHPERHRSIDQTGGARRIHHPCPARVLPRFTPRRHSRQMNDGIHGPAERRANRIGCRTPRAARPSSARAPSGLSQLSAGSPPGRQPADTSCPSCTSCSTRCRPTKPSAPVTRTLTSRRASLASRSGARDQRPPSWRSAA